jgi:hypothetical protein
LILRARTSVPVTCLVWRGFGRRVVRSRPGVYLLMVCSKGLHAHPFHHHHRHTQPHIIDRTRGRRQKKRTAISKSTNFSAKVLIWLLKQKRYSPVSVAVNTKSPCRSFWPSIMILSAGPTTSKSTSKEPPAWTCVGAVSDADHLKFNVVHPLPISFAIQSAISNLSSLPQFQFQFRFQFQSSEVKGRVREENSQRSKKPPSRPYSRHSCKNTPSRSQKAYTSAPLQRPVMRGKPAGCTIKLRVSLCVVVD